MIQSIEVENYKVLDSIKVEGFSKINFFVGKNDCGKTSLLEAMLLNIDPNRANNFVRMANVRGFQLHNKNLDTFFSKFNTKKPILITTKTNDENLCVKITPKTYSQKLNNVSQINGESASNNLLENDSGKHFLGIDIEVMENNTKQHMFFELDGSSIKVISLPTKNSTAVMHFSNTSIMDMTQDVVDIRINNKEDEMLKYLQFFNEEILDVDTGGNQIFVKLKNMPKRLPFGLMGEGFRKYLNIIANLVANKHKYILIDEIENGLHFETMKKLINSIIELSKTSDIQFFITTHSYEFLETLSMAAQEKDYKDVAIFDISRTKLKGLQAYKYDADGLNNLIENDTEFRK